MRILFFLLTVLFFVDNTYSQGRFIENYEIGLFFGTRDLRIDTDPDRANFDFLDYMSALDYEPFGYQYIGFSGNILFRNNFELRLKWYSTDDIIPVNFNGSVQKGLNEFIGLNAGITYFQVYTGDYQLNALNPDENYTFVSEHPYLTPRYHLGWFAGPTLNYMNKRFFANLKLNFGFSSFIPFSESHQLVKTNSNFRQVLEIETTPQNGFFFFPELILGFTVYQSSRLNLGVRLHSTAMFSKKNLDYLKSTYTWSWDNVTHEKVITPKHPFGFIESDLGIFLRFLPRRQ